MTSIKLDRSAFLAWHEGLSEDIKIEISNSIIQEFAKKHLKPLENNSFIKERIEQSIKRFQESIDTELTNSIQKEIGTLKKSTTWNGKDSFEFNPTFKKTLDDEIKRIIDIKTSEILYTADKLFKEKEQLMLKRFEDSIDYRFRQYEEQLETKMANHFNAILSKYLKLGMEN